MKRYVCILIVVMVFFFPRISSASNDDIPWQAYVVDPDGNPISGPHLITFRLYDSELSEESVWEETQTITFDEGVVVTVLGDLTPFENIFVDYGDLFLGVQIDQDSEMSPRQIVSTVAWAQWSRQCETAVTAQSLSDDYLLTNSQISNGAVFSNNLADGAVTSSKIAAGSVGLNELSSTTVIPGAYTLATITVDADGRITSAANGSASSSGSGGTITGVTAGSGLSGGGSSGNVSLSLVASGVGTTQLADSSVTSAKVADGSLTNADISSSAAIVDTKLATIASAGKVADTALSENVSLLGSSIDSSEIVDGTIATGDLADSSFTSAKILDGTLTNADINASAAIDGTKITPNFGSQDIVTTGGGFKMMVGPFHEKNLNANTTLDLEVGSEGNAISTIAMVWPGSVMGISLSCSGSVTAGSITAEARVNGGATNFITSMTGGSSSYTAQNKDVTTFAAGDVIGCQVVSSSLSPTTLDCVCSVFVEM